VACLLVINRSFFLHFFSSLKHLVYFGSTIIFLDEIVKFILQNLHFILDLVRISVFGKIIIQYMYCF
jgi:hypothetical protein